jgi:SAM-dependent methyltransferase
MDKYPGNDIQGWMNDDELDWQFKMAQQMDSIIEIGCWKGRTTHALLSGCKGPVVAVDHFRGSVGEDEAHAEAKEYDISAEFYSNVGHFKNLGLLKMDSIEASKFFVERSFDMVFIDGSHDYDSVLADIKAWFTKSRKLFCGHDFNWPGVERAVHQMFGGVASVSGSLWSVPGFSWGQGR